MVIMKPNGNLETYYGEITIEELERKYGKNSMILPVENVENPYYTGYRSDYEEERLKEEERMKETYYKMFGIDNIDNYNNYSFLDKYNNYSFNIDMSDICLKEKDGDIKSITVNKKKRLVTVVFKDDDIQIAKCDENDVFDEYIGVLVCIAQRQFSSKTSMKKIINKFLNTKKNKKFNKEETEEIKK